MMTRPPASLVDASLFALADVSSDPIAIFDGDLRHVYANDAVCRLMGLTRQDVLGKSYAELPLSPDNARTMSAAIREVFATGQPQHVEVRGGRARSRSTFFDIQYQPQFDESGCVVYVGSVSRDISRLRMAEDEARRVATRLQLLLDTVGVGIMGVDRDLTVTFANAFAEKQLRRLGYRGPGQPLRELLPTGLGETSISRLRRVFDEGIPLDREVDAGPPEHRRRLHILLEPERDQTGAVVGCVIVYRDITREHQLRTQLHLSERLASLGRIAAGVAHEISNPLASVCGNLELASNDLARFAAQHLDLTARVGDMLDMLRDARDGAERIRVIVDDIGLLARDEDPSSGRVGLDDVARTVIQMLGSAMRRKAQLEVSIEPVPLVKGSAIRLAQALSNIVQNAIHALPDGRPREDNRLAIFVSRDDLEVVVVVRDNGRGIAPDEMARVFDPFYTTRAVGDGVGLGLTVAHGIITQHGGRLTLQSELGAGTSAIIALPVADPDS